MFLWGRRLERFESCGWERKWMGEQPEGGYLYPEMLTTRTILNYSSLTIRFYSESPEIHRHLDDAFVWLGSIARRRRSEYGVRSTPYGGISQQSELCTYSSILHTLCMYSVSISILYMHSTIEYECRMNGHIPSLRASVCTEYLRSTIPPPQPSQEQTG